MYLKQNSLDSVDQDTEKSKYYEQNSEATLSTKSTDKVESTDMRKLSSDKTKLVMKSNMYFLNLQNMIKRLELILSLQELIQTASMQTEKIKKTVQMEIKVVI